MKKTALITGITGQDGSFLAEFLISKGYEVHGVLRRSSSFNTGRIEHLYLDEWVRDMKKSRLINLHWGDMTDSSSILRILQTIQPDEIYNLAAQSHVKVSFDVPEYTAETDAVGVLRLLEAIRILGMEKKTRSERQRPSIRALPTVWPSNMVFGLSKTIVRVMACMPLMASSSITKASVAAKPSLRARLRWL